MPGELLLTYYGDDFTGSTDSMEALTLGGVPTVLLLEIDAVDLVRQRFPHARAIGLAGLSRSWTPEQMDEHLPAIFDRLRQLEAPVLHYKVCSTFDSSPAIGSIGRVIEIGQATLESPFVPLVVGAPALNRYTLFGNHFAASRSDGLIYRLDRHPTMSQHPATPMDESDLRRHLAHQTSKSIGLVDILALADQPDSINRRLSDLLADGADAVLFDVLDDLRLARVGEVIWRRCHDHPLFAVGSSGVEYALAAHWRAVGLLPETAALHPPGPADQMLVISGSCSPETHQQIVWAADHGFDMIALEAARLIDSAEAGLAIAEGVSRALACLATGRSVVLHTCLGPRDPRIEAAIARLRTCGYPTGSMGAVLGARLGALLSDILHRSGVRRVLVAGGDTSGHAVHELGIYALELLAPTAPGSPLCRAYAHDPALDGLEIVLKGGQVGGTDYFGIVQQGGV